MKTNSFSEFKASDIDPRTAAVHAGRWDFNDLGVHSPPIDLSSTYPVPDLSSGMASLDAMVAGGLPAGSAVYSRLYNPTVARTESAIAELEGASACIAFASGMAAYTAALIAARQSGNHVVAVRPLYGSADHLLACGMLGLDVTFAEPDSVGAACKENTSLVLIETPANPTLDLLDIEHIVSQAGDIPVMVDATFATPVLLNPLNHGAALVLHSATKALSGHGDVLAGVICTNSTKWTESLRQVRLLTGNVLHPMAAFLLHRGLATLHIRVERSQENAKVIAQRLSEHSGVSKVFYPGLGDTDPKGVLGRQLRGPGGTLSFELSNESEGAASRFMSRLSMITSAVSLGSTDTLIQQPSSLTHRVVDAGVLDKHGISPRMLRLSVGIEHVDDIWRDLNSAFEG